MRALRPIGGTRSLTLPGSPLLLGLLMWLAACLPIAHAQDLSPREQPYDIPAQGLAEALITYSDQSGVQVVTSGYDLVDRSTAGISGNYTAATALDALLAGSGMQYRIVGESTVALTDPNAPPITLAPAEGGASGEGSGGFGDGSASNVAEARRAGVEEIIVTGQKKEERLQDVPIAISAFSMEQLDAQKIEGGFDLLKAIPNVTFSKTNFSGYNFQIRGVGTQSISATSDPGAAVAFNNSAIIQNRLFEQEYLDIERVEVLRGPQGTLYGRNATAGVINVISHKPVLGTWDGMIDLEVGNYSTGRVRGMFNVPVGETLALRGAYASTDRAGYTRNTLLNSQTDGRDLWTGRLSLRWQPTDRFRADIIWERFEEDDDRLRTGKQLCHKDEGPEIVGNTILAETSPPGVVGNLSDARSDGIFSQGCLPGDLYTEDAFGTPNGFAINFLSASLYLKDAGVPLISSAVGVRPGTNEREAIFQNRDPYGGRRQSTSLREIESIRDPVYRASADLFQFEMEFDLTDDLVITSQSSYVDDETYSFQDFNRFSTDPIFTDTSELSPIFGKDYSQLAPGGVFCDPQIGCSDRIAGFDIAQAKARQFNQEFRIQSAFDGPVNFSFGANYTEFDTLVDYYIMYNIVTALAVTAPINAPGGPLGPGVYDPAMTDCAASNYWFNFPAAPAPRPPGYPNPPTNSPAVPSSDPNSPCPYIDPNPVESINGEGHNYFRSKNPYDLKSWAGFGEIYWNIQEALKLTVGLRYTRDIKTFTPVPTQLLLAPSFLAGGTVAKGYPEKDPIEQRWGEWTGRIVLDWKPRLDFTDETLIYGSYSRGYKGGGANPPTPGFATLEETKEILLAQGYGQGHVDEYFPTNVYPVLELTGNEYGPTFEPEFVNAFEIGVKNTLFGGALMLNTTAFYYDYTDYQVSQIRDRTAVNENFDAEMWGLELEAVFAPSADWQFLANVGYLKTKIDEGETSIDIINRTQGNPDYTLIKPWVQLPSNCVVPTHVAESWLAGNSQAAYFVLCDVGGLLGLIGQDGVTDTQFGDGTQPYEQSNYPELNGGAGLRADLGGNELPNSPRWTANFGMQYGFDMLRGQWRTTLRGDAYWQSDSYHRVYNLEPYDRLQEWYNVNVAVKVEQPSQGLAIELYVKNVLDDDPITGAFLNSDDTGLTTNVFTLDPRLIGLSITKQF